MSMSTELSVMSSIRLSAILDLRGSRLYEDIDGLLAMSLIIKNQV